MILVMIYCNFCLLQGLTGTPGVQGAEGKLGPPVSLAKVLKFTNKLGIMNVLIEIFKAAILQEHHRHGCYHAINGSDNCVKT